MTLSSHGHRGSGGGGFFFSARAPSRLLCAFSTAHGPSGRLHSTCLAPADDRNRWFLQTHDIAWNKRRRRSFFVFFFSFIILIFLSDGGEIAQKYIICQTSVHAYLYYTIYLYYYNMYITII